jgi:anti-sigma regulatory factor (Ser/Thr protein kinase)
MQLAASTFRAVPVGGCGKRGPSWIKGWRRRSAEKASANTWRRPRTNQSLLPTFGDTRLGVSTSMQLRVFPTVEAPSQARRELSSLANRIDAHSLSDVRSVISELVAMSVANGAHSPIEVSIHLEEQGLEGFVFDDGTGVRAVRRPESALVLRILDGLVEEWGANERENRIWFRMKVQSVGPSRDQGVCHRGW